MHGIFNYWAALFFINDQRWFFDWINPTEFNNWE